ncbi:MAG: efflux RND transporter periplasmic adaptor subunit [Legionellaceae bacterium]|nr:efflux RND transporter periplasmic adaptor subunit [Legionellaceae bacterium]
MKIDKHIQTDKRAKLIKIGLILLVFIFLLSWLVKSLTKKTPNYPVPEVVVQKPKLVKITDYVTQTGTLVAYNSVDIVARIEGFLDGIKFTDGTFVKKNQELFVIEPQPYLDKLKESQASVEAKTASLAYAKIEHERQQRMYKENATSLNSVQAWATRVAEAKADLDKAMANTDNASINYSYTHVLAPFDGRIGRHLVDQGNLVGNGAATKLATIEQIDPIYVYFNLNELDLLKLRARAKTRGIAPDDLSQIPAYVTLQNKPELSHEGKLNFVNTSLNASTGTMEFRALLSNKELVFLPGLFVQVRIPISDFKEELTVPATAVQYDQIGAYVLALDKNNIVMMKRVETGPTEQGFISITKGLKAGDNVIVSGLQNATPGNKVSPIQSESKQK